MKTDTEPKENNCLIKTYCGDSDGCAYYSDAACGYNGCYSVVAQVNALTIRLQELTGKKVGLG